MEGQERQPIRKPAPVGIVYCSQAGSAKRYAEWLAESLGGDAEPLDQMDVLAFFLRRTVVLCTWVRNGTLVGASLFRRVMEADPTKRYAVVAVGAAPIPRDEGERAELEAVVRREFPEETYPQLTWCYCQGSFRIERLGECETRAARAYLRMLRRQAKHGSACAAAQHALMRAGFDGCNRAFLDPLVEALTGAPAGKAGT